MVEFANRISFLTSNEAHMQEVYRMAFASLVSVSYSFILFIIALFREREFRMNDFVRVGSTVFYIYACLWLSSELDNLYGVAFGYLLCVHFYALANLLCATENYGYFEATAATMVEVSIHIYHQENLNQYLWVIGVATFVLLSGGVYFDSKRKEELEQMPPLEETLPQQRLPVDE